MNRYPPEQARILLADTRRELHDVVSEAYRIGYAIDPGALTELAANAAVSMQKRMPGPEITPDRLARRDWWTGPRLFVLIDDYDLLVSAAGMGGPLQPLVPLLAHGGHIGMHLVVARSTSGAMRAMLDPLLRRMWELGNPGLLLSYPNEEGKFLGEAKPRTLPPGRAQLVTRRDVRLMQLGLV
jgi:S-DNA-T family DNA segregation ATPase FtsK/SpoIIIE